MKAWRLCEKIILLVFALVLIFPYPEARAEEEKEGDVDIRAIPPILDPQYRHRKRRQFEISPYGGACIGQSLGQTWIAGAKGFFHLNNTVAVGAEWGISKLLTNRNSPFGSIMEDDILQTAEVQVMFSNDAALRMGRTLIEMDFYGTLGIGGMYINDEWNPAGVVGGGVKFYSGIPWLAFRIDVNNYIHSTHQPGEDPVDFDIVFAGGVSLLFPINPSPYETTGSNP